MGDLQVLLDGRSLSALSIVRHAAYDVRLDRHLQYHPDIPIYIIYPSVPRTSFL